MNVNFKKIIAATLGVVTLLSVPAQAQLFTKEFATVVRTEKTCAFWSGVANSGYRIKQTDYNSAGVAIAYRWTKTPCGKSAEPDILPQFRNLPPLSEVLKMPLPKRGSSLLGCNEHNMAVSVNWKGERNMGSGHRCTVRNNSNR